MSHFLKLIEKETLSDSEVEVTMDSDNDSLPEIDSDVDNDTGSCS